MDRLRMVEWALLAVIFYALALIVTQPQIQTALWKMGHITVGAYLGYWADRTLLGRVSAHSSPARVVARAIIIAAAIWGMSGGL